MGNIKRKQFTEGIKITDFDRKAFDEETARMQPYKRRYS